MRSSQRQRKIILTNFEVGDCGIVPPATGKAQKLSKKMEGASPHCYGSKRFNVRCRVPDERYSEPCNSSRLCHVCRDDSNVNFNYLREHTEHIESVYETVHSILGTENHGGVLYIRIRWESPDDFEDITLQPFYELCEDIQEMVLDYIRHSRDDDAKMFYAK